MKLSAQTCAAAPCAETVTHDVHELAGSWFIGVIAHDRTAIGQPFDLQVTITEPDAAPQTYNELPEIDFPTPDVDETVETIILTNHARFESFYGELEADELLGGLQTLAGDDTVNGVVYDLDMVQSGDGAFAIREAYGLWDNNLTNPGVANHVSRTIKAFLYDTILAYPNLKYIVLVGGDEVIPHRRMIDNTLVANQRNYALAEDPAINAAFQNRYYLVDDYYAASLPFSAFGRELFLPQYAVGRLVETPDEIMNMINVYRDDGQTLNPQTALVTGYDFLTDQATAIAGELEARGVAANTGLVNDTWDAAAFRSAALGTQQYDLISLNSHFDHHLFYPNGPNEPPNYVYATELGGTGLFEGSLVFSVGCQAALNVRDWWYPTATPFTGADWAQYMAGEGATYIGNTGFGYGDHDLLAYSERLMLNFVRHIGAGDTPSVGGALRDAKQTYFNSIAAGSLSVYDEKVMGEMVLYGLPMQRVAVPSPSEGDAPTGIDAAPSAAATAQAGPVATAAVPTLTEQTFNLNFDYTPHTASDGRGAYYTITGEDDLHLTGGRPVLPRTTRNLDHASDMARGVLMVGGSFTDIPGYDPVILRLIAEDVSEFPGEGRFDLPQWYTRLPASVNRFRDGVEGIFRQRLVITPNQFYATTGLNEGPRTVGVLRQYDSLTLVVYSSDYMEFDTLAPFIWNITATPGNMTLDFSSYVVDEDQGADEELQATGVMQVVVLYRHLSENVWSRVDLTHNPTTNRASRLVELSEPGEYEYFVQAVDNAGNVSAVLDHGNYFRVTVTDGDPLPEEDFVFASPRKAGSIGGLSFDSSDILVYTTETESWSMYFDGSAMGMTKGISAFALLPNGSILLSPASGVNLPGVGPITPQDIVRFTPSALGPETAGSYSVLLDGSDVGLVTSAEAIAGISLTQAGRLVISTVGSGSVPTTGGQEMAFTGSDLLRFQANTFGSGTSGYWERHMDGAAVGLGNVRLGGHWIDPNTGDIYFTPRQNLTLDEQTYTRSDIVRCAPEVTGPITECALSLYWKGSDHDFGNVFIDNIDLGVGLSVVRPTGSITIVKEVTEGSGEFTFTGDLGEFVLSVPADPGRTFTGLQTGAYLVSETPADGWQVSTITCEGDLDGGSSYVADNQLLIDLDSNEAITCTFRNAPAGGPAGDTILVSPARPGKLDGVQFDNSDILRYSPDGEWSFFFDGSALGLKAAGVTDFHLMPDGSLLLSLFKGGHLPGIGRVNREDIIRFTPDVAGDYTAGTFVMFFDGSDVDLTGGTEAIDAFSIAEDGRLIISTRGRATVKVNGVDMRVAGQDLLAFTFNTIGSSTSGTWELYFEGADVGLKNENIDGVWVDPQNGDLYLSVVNNFNVGGGVSGTGGTIFICTPGSLGADTTCAYRNYWSAKDAGVKQLMDGLYIQR